jgi:hypothetical protein
MEHVLPITHAASPGPPPQCVAQATDTHGGAPPILGVAIPPRPPSFFHPLIFVLLLFLLLPALGAVGIASYFRLSSSSRALRSAVMESVPGQWHKRLALNVGSLTLDVARFGLSFAPLPPDAEAALQSIQRADVGIYRLEKPTSPPDYSTMVTTADKSMRRRGWERIVGVAQGSQFVAIYAPANTRLKDLSCCVAVLNEHDLVIVSARGNISALLDLAQKHIHDHGPFLGDFSRF